MSVSESQKSPLNVAMGALLQQLRQRHAWRPEHLPGELGLSKSYFRAIELGARYLPAQTAIGLANALGTHFMPVGAVLALIVFLDARRPENPLAADFDEIKRRALSARAAAPYLETLIAWLVESIESSNGLTDERILLGAELLEQELFRPWKAGVESSSRPTSIETLPISKMSPPFELLVEMLSQELSLFPPQMDVPSLQSWISRYSDDIELVRCYVEDVQNLIADAPHFNWGPLRNRHRAKMHVLVPHNSEPPASKLDMLLRDIIRPKLIERNDGKDEGFLSNLTVSAVDEQWFKPLRDLLIFDRVTRKQAKFVSPVEERTVGTPGSRYQRFENGWVYQIRPRADAATPRLVGFLGAHVEEGDSFVGVMDREHTDLCWRTFSECIESIKSERNTIPVK